MKRGTFSYWIPWYVDEPENKVICWICGDSFTKMFRMLSHLGYINVNDERDTNIKLCKNMTLHWCVHSKDVAA